MWAHRLGYISLGSSVYQLQLTVQRMSAGDGWARISTIKMLSHPSGQENDAKPKREEVGLFNLKVTSKWNGCGAAPYGISIGVFGEFVLPGITEIQERQAKLAPALATASASASPVSSDAELRSTLYPSDLLHTQYVHINIPRNSAASNINLAYENSSNLRLSILFR